MTLLGVVAVLVGMAGLVRALACSESAYDTISLGVVLALASYGVWRHWRQLVPTFAEFSPRAVRIRYRYRWVVHELAPEAVELSVVRLKVALTMAYRFEWWLIIRHQDEIILLLGDATVSRDELEHVKGFLVQALTDAPASS